MSAPVRMALKHPYRADIDGLRAIGVSSVVAFHAFPAVFRSGFVGVDIFFVISGFLISGIIFSELAEDRFSLVDFYFRRLRRIFPALILVFVACLSVGWFIMLSDEYMMLGKHVLTGAAFVSNLALNQESSYFDVAGELKPLLHLWSLGIEEQFYFVWPTVLMLVWRFRIPLGPVLLLLTAASFVANLWYCSFDRSDAFYLPQSRFWELLIGAILAYLTRFKADVLKRWIGSRENALSWVGASVLAAAFILIHPWRVFPGWWALVPTLGCAMIIAAGPAARFNFSVLSHPAFTWVGLISFPLYLWHRPVLVFLRIFEMKNASVSLRFLAVVLSVILAWATYKFVEKPLRRDFPRRSFACGLVAAMLLPAIAGCCIFVSAGLNLGGPRTAERSDYLAYFENSAPQLQYLHAANIPQKYRYQCDFFRFDGLTTPREKLDEACYTPTQPNRLFLWGDSHAQQYYYGLRRALPADWDVLQVASSGCPADLVLEDSPDEYCKHSNWVAVEKIKAAHPQIVLISFHSEPSVARLEKMADALRAAGVTRVIFGGPVPWWTTDLPKLIVAKHWKSDSDRLPNYARPDIMALDDALKKNFDGQSNIEYFSPSRILCNSDGCMTRIGRRQKEDIVSWDTGHLTPVASDYVAQHGLAALILRPTRAGGYVASAESPLPASQN